jgi:hypothetical protein
LAEYYGTECRKTWKLEIRTGPGGPIERLGLDMNIAIIIIIEEKMKLP